MQKQLYFERVMFRMSAIGARAELRLRELLAPLGLIPHSYAVLHRIAAGDGVTQQRVADLTGIRRSIMVALVDGLEEQGLVERQRHPHDRRANALNLTPRGHDVLQAADAAADELDDEILSMLTSSQRERFVTAIRRVDDGFGSKGGIHPDTTPLQSRPDPT